ncbi:hypothetical protein ACWGQ5_16330 [Streptomyces sp. NPDC055722]
MRDPVRPGQPKRAALLAPIEEGRWLVSLSGSRGGEPADTHEDFVPFALQLDHPLIGMLVARSTPLTDVSLSSPAGSMRRYFEQAHSWPEGLVVLGDAVAAHNTVHGQGMAVAALAARHLKDEVKKAGVGQAGLAHQVQRDIARFADAAWSLATAHGGLPSPPHRPAAGIAANLFSRYQNRVIRTVSASSRVAAALAAVTAMEAEDKRLLFPDVLLATALESFKRSRMAPPLTADEELLLNLGAGQ